MLSVCFCQSLDQVSPTYVGSTADLCTTLVYTAVSAWCTSLAHAVLSDLLVVDYEWYNLSWSKHLAQLKLQLQSQADALTSYSIQAPCRH